MKVIITSKNFNASDHLKETIEKKFVKLGKYFAEDIVANVMLSQERGRQKMEATIKAKGAIFRAEEASNDIYDVVDRVAEKLSSQMSRYKTKLIKSHKTNKALMFDAVPEYDQPDDEINVVKKKRFQLEPMSVDEAIIQMELLQHTFFVFINQETDNVNIVYRRNDNNYGLLETTY